MPDRSAASSDATARRVSDLVWIAWLVAAGILVVLTVNVVRHLAAGGAHEHPSAALFRAGEARTLRPLLGSAVLTEWQVNAVALALLVLGLAWYVTGTALVRRRTGEVWPWWRTACFVGRPRGVCVRDVRRHRRLRPGSVQCPHDRPPGPGHGRPRIACRRRSASAGRHGEPAGYRQPHPTGDQQLGRRPPHVTTGRARLLRSRDRGQPPDRPHGHHHGADRGRARSNTSSTSSSATSSSCWSSATSRSSGGCPRPYVGFCSPSPWRSTPSPASP